MPPKAEICITYLVYDPSKTVNDKSNKRWHRIDKGCDRQEYEDREVCLHKVLDASVAAIVLANVTFFIEYDCT